MAGRAGSGHPRGLRASPTVSALLLTQAVAFLTGLPGEPHVNLELGPERDLGPARVLLLTSCPSASLGWERSHPTSRAPVGIRSQGCKAPR